MGLVNKEVANSEVCKWLDFKKVSEKKRESKKEYIETIVDAISEGDLELKSDGMILIQKLKFPGDKQGAVTVLEYQPRIKVNEIQSQMIGVKATDPQSLLSAYVSALTKQPKAAIVAMDTEDWEIAQAIASFFI